MPGMPGPGCFFADAVPTIARIAATANAHLKVLIFFLSYLFLLLSFLPRHDLFYLGRRTLKQQTCHGTERHLHATNDETPSDEE